MVFNFWHWRFLDCWSCYWEEPGASWKLLELIMLACGVHRLSLQQWHHEAREHKGTAKGEMVGRNQASPCAVTRAQSTKTWAEMRASLFPGTCLVINLGLCCGRSFSVAETNRCLMDVLFPQSSGAAQSPGCMPQHSFLRMLVKEFRISVCTSWSSRLDSSKLRPVSD